MTLIIRNRSELPKLLTSRDPDVRFEIESLSERENEELHGRLSRWYRKCGCKQATVGLLVGICLAVGFGITASLGWWQTAILSAGLGLASSIIAKVSFKYIARLQLRRALDQELGS
jgi:hypothetical protein